LGQINNSAQEDVPVHVPTLEKEVENPEDSLEALESLHSIGCTVKTSQENLIPESLVTKHIELSL